MTTTTAPLWVAPDLDLSTVSVLLCDADGNLFPSEEPAFDASAGVTNAFLAELGIPAQLTAEELRATTLGKSFRTTATGLARAHGVAVHSAVLDRWVAEELRQVTGHLASVLRPDPTVLEPLRRLDEHVTLTAVSSSALSRLDACFRATGLTDLIPPWARYSAQDSLPTPTSKPDPAIYRWAGQDLAVCGRQAVAVEDSPVGARSAIAAGFSTIGNLAFVSPAEQPERAVALRDAGVEALVTSWTQVADLLPVGDHCARSGDASVRLSRLGFTGRGEGPVTVS